MGLSRINRVVLSLLPSQKRVTSARLSDLKRLLKAAARLLPKLFHFRQNCCCESMPGPAVWNVLAVTRQRTIVIITLVGW